MGQARMGTGSPKLVSSYIKIDWAVKCIDQLKKGLETFEEENKIRPLVEENPETAISILYVETPPVPLDVHCCVGDIIHCLRSALDCAVSQLMAERTGKQDNRVHFPIHQDEKQLRDSFGSIESTRPCCGTPYTKKGSNAVIQEELPELSEMIFQLFRPWKEGNGLLWALNRADNVNKHKQITVAVGSVTFTGLDFDTEHSSHAGNLFRIPAGRRINVGVGRKIDITNEIKSSMEFVFGPETPFGGRPVIKTLIEAAVMIDKMVSKIELTYGNAEFARPRWPALFDDS